MLGQRQRRWPNIQTVYGEFLVFTGKGILISPQIVYHLYIMIKQCIFSHFYMFVVVFVVVLYIVVVYELLLFLVKECVDFAPELCFILCAHTTVILPVFFGEHLNNQAFNQILSHTCLKM